MFDSFGISLDGSSVSIKVESSDLIGELGMDGGAAAGSWNGRE
jgi:hypothetical protein